MQAEEEEEELFLMLCALIICTFGNEEIVVTSELVLDFNYFHLPLKRGHGI